MHEDSKPFSWYLDNLYFYYKKIPFNQLKQADLFEGCESFEHYQVTLEYKGKHAPGYVNSATFPFVLGEAIPKEANGSPDNYTVLLTLHKEAYWGYIDFDEFCKVAHLDPCREKEHALYLHKGCYEIFCKMRKVLMYVNKYATVWDFIEVDP